MCGGGRGEIQQAQLLLPTREDQIVISNHLHNNHVVAFHHFNALFILTAIDLESLHPPSADCHPMGLLGDLKPKGRQ